MAVKPRIIRLASTFCHPLTYGGHLGGDLANQTVMFFEVLQSISKAGILADCIVCY